MEFYLKEPSPILSLGALEVNMNSHVKTSNQMGVGLRAASRAAVLEMSGTPGPSANDALSWTPLIRKHSPLKLLHAVRPAHSDHDVPSLTHATLLILYHVVGAIEHGLMWAAIEKDLHEEAVALPSLFRRK